MSTRLQDLFEGPKANVRTDTAGGLALLLEAKLVAFDRVVSQVYNDKRFSEVRCLPAELSQPRAPSGWTGTRVSRDEISAILHEAFPLPPGGSFSELLGLVD